MYDYIIIHGSYGCQYENWFPWLYEKLTEMGKNVLVAQFPIGEKEQNYENWSKVLDAYKHLIDENTTFIGHSLAPAFIVDYLIENQLSVKDLYLVAPFYGIINIPDFDKVNCPFFIREDLQRIVEYTKKRVCLISKTDPYVPNELSDEFAEKIRAEKIYFEDAGHFNKAAGYLKFEELFEMLK